MLFFFLHDTATTETYTLSLHDALPISKKLFRIRMSRNFGMKMLTMTNLSTECLIQLTKHSVDRFVIVSNFIPKLRLRSEERFSRNAETDLVCRLLLEKKKFRTSHANS